MRDYDVIVVGLGIMGVSTLFHLRHSGARVCGIEAGGPTHRFGSSHGETRIFRRAYWEGEKYLPLLNRAHDLWTALQAASDEKLIAHTGGIFIGPKSTGVVLGSRRTAQEGKIDHEVLDAAQIRARFPAFHIPDGMEAIYEPGAYAIMANKARLHMMDAAIESGVTVEFGKRVRAVKEQRDAWLMVTTTHGEQLRARSVVVTTGPWIARELLPELGSCLSANQVPIYWFDIRNGHERQFDSRSFPVFLYDHSDGHLLYGIPAGVSSERGVKIGFHNRQQVPLDPSHADRRVREEHREEISRYVAQLFPGLDPTPVLSHSCFYTMSTDESFVIGHSERSANIVYASACSGHGFKFGTAVGESLALLAQGGKPLVDLSVFSASRFLR